MFIYFVFNMFVGVMCMGPCSIVAVKKGDMSCSYDGPFLFAEVNSDVVEWVRQSDRTWIEFKRTTNTYVFVTMPTSKIHSLYRNGVDNKSFFGPYIFLMQIGPTRIDPSQIILIV